MACNTLGFLGSAAAFARLLGVVVIFALTIPQELLKLVCQTSTFIFISSSKIVARAFFDSKYYIKPAPMPQRFLIVIPGAHIIEPSRKDWSVWFMASRVDNQRLVNKI